MSDDAPKRKPRKSHKTNRPPLSEQDIKFAKLLFNRGATKKTIADCYLEAGFPPRNTTASLNQAASNRVKNPDFRNYYRKLQDQAADAAQVDANRVVQGLARVAFGCMPSLFDERGRIKLPHEWPAEMVAAVESVDSEEIFETVVSTDPDTGKKVRRKELVGYTRKVRLAKKVEALRLLAQILRLIGQDVDAGKSAQKGGAVIEVELGPDYVPPPEVAGGASTGG